MIQYEHNENLACDRKCSCYNNSCGDAVAIVDIIRRFVADGTSLDEAVEKAMRVNQDGFGLKDRILLNVWLRQGRKPHEEDGKIYYLNNRNSIASSIAEDLEITREYVYNKIYELRHDDLLDTKIITHKGKRYTLLHLTDQGIEWVMVIKDSLKSDYERECRDETITTTE